MYESMFSKSLVNLNVCVNNADELFDFIGKDAHEKGFANENYVRGVEKKGGTVSNWINFF